MITIYDNKKVKKENGVIKFLVELRGLSTDTKPTTILNGEVENGSAFIEIDTQNIFFFDGTSKEWKGTE